MRFLVTGGCGFIGSHLVDALCAAEHEVIVIDDLSNGHYSNLNHDANLIIGDVCNRAIVMDCMQAADGCFHLAAIPSVQQTNNHLVACHHTNSTGTVTILECARELAVHRAQYIPIVLASSAAVYGKPGSVPLSEDSPVSPISPYGVDKYAGELHAKCASQLHGFPATALRFFNVYGPRQDPSSAYAGVISIFTDQIQRGDCVRIYGTGMQARDFIYVLDVVRACKAAMSAMKALQASKTEKSLFQTLNVCTGSAVSVLDLAQLISAMLGMPLKISWEAERSGDIDQSMGSCARIEELLGFSAFTSLDEGLQDTISWLK